MVMLAKTASQNGVRTLSDAAAKPWRLGVGYEFTQRPDGLTALVQMYGLKIQDEPVLMDIGLLYAALKTDRIDLAAANATDGMKFGQMKSGAAHRRVPASAQLRAQSFT